jgi:hypothetical protein
MNDRLALTLSIYQAASLVSTVTANPNLLLLLAIGYTEPMLCDPVFFIISRRDIERADLRETLVGLKHLTSSVEVAKAYCERVDIAFHGYDDDPRELWEIPEVREFVYKLDTHFPYWLFFLDKKLLGLRCLAWCFLPPFLKEEAQREIYPKRLAELLERRWFPALNAIAGWVGMSDDEIVAITDRSVEYLLRGPTSA